VDKEKQQHLRIDRQYCRVDTGVTCEAGLPGDDLSTTWILNLSVGGMKFRCTQQTIQRILPEEQRTLWQVMGVEIEIHFDLKPADGPVTSINTNARVIHSERLAQDEFHVGIQFLGLDNTAVELLEAYIGEIKQQQRI
jgi:c-di-GMP-binding flagellar brake protein YcgR